MASDADVWGAYFWPTGLAVLFALVAALVVLTVAYRFFVLHAHEAATG